MAEYIKREDAENVRNSCDTVTGAVDCIICDTPIPIYDHWLTHPIAICSECRKRLKDLLYKGSERSRKNED